MEKSLELGVAMEYYFGFSEIGEHGHELIRAGRIAESWADALKIEIQE